MINTYPSNTESIMDKLMNQIVNFIATKFKNFDIDVQRAVKSLENDILKTKIRVIA